LLGEEAVFSRAASIILKSDNMAATIVLERIRGAFSGSLPRANMVSW